MWNIQVPFLATGTAEKNFVNKEQLLIRKETMSTGLFVMIMRLKGTTVFLFVPDLFVPNKQKYVPFEHETNKKTSRGREDNN